VERSLKNVLIANISFPSFPNIILSIQQEDAVNQIFSSIAMKGINI